MNFFRKSHSEDISKTNKDEVKASNPENADAVDNTIEEKQTIKDPAINLNDPAVQQTIRNEARQMRMNEQIMTESHLLRTQDALRLNETKMENIEENLARTRKQQERVHRYQELTMELNEQKKHLYEVNKQLASSIDERDDLHRFEEFENVQGKFQRLMTLEGLRHIQKQRMSQLTREHETGTTELEREQKRLVQLKDEKREAINRFGLGLDAVGEAQGIESLNDYLSIVKRQMEERGATKHSDLTAIEKEIAELQLEKENHSATMESLQTHQQTLQPHQYMAQHCELILERLTRLRETKEEVARLEHQQAECQRKQSNENDMLGRVYSDYQQVEQKIQALTDELHVHREHNLGLESYRLQERAMQHKLRREMLIGAQSLWARIANGYEMIEDRMQAINAMRLKQEDLAGKIDTLDKELGILRRTCHEKEYTFTLSKSQNVIQLRSDLKEGTSCTVCGATHHPYHSDTMLEQNKLIGEFKMDYEQMANELRAKEQLMMEMRLEEAATAAKKEEAENTLITLRQLQNGYVHDWQMYSHLDRSFAECDSSTNADARTAMLRQLVENITTEVDKAQKELDTFNFHQSRINELTEQIAAQEQNKNDIITRLNEVNTGCQVIAHQLDSAVALKQKASETYSHLFEILDKNISLHDWFDIWQRSHEALTMRIQEIAKDWNDVTTKIEKAENEQHLLEQKLLHITQIHDEIVSQSNLIENDLKAVGDQYEEGQKKIGQLLGNDSAKQRLRMYIDDLQTSAKQLEDHYETLLQITENERQQAGRESENLDQGTFLDDKAAVERQNVDVWMRGYNANHSPVQYSELEKVFSTDRNWNDMRTRLRSIEMDSLLTQARVDKLNSQLIALQSEGSINVSDTNMVQHQLSVQIETLEKRRREVMFTIATLTQQIELHKKAKSQIKEDKMKE